MLFSEKDESIIYNHSTHRFCGECERVLPLEMFYKDGRNRDGSTRYRRDCKRCYVKRREANKKRRKRRK